MKSNRLLYILVFFYCGHVHASGPELIDSSTPPQAASLNVGDNERLKLIQNSRGIKRSRVVKLQKSAFLSNVMSFVTLDNRQININKIREERRSDADITWYGKTDSGGEAIFTMNGDKISGVVRDMGKTFEIRNLNNQHHVLIEIDQALLPPEHPAEHPSGIKEKIK